MGAYESSHQREVDFKLHIAIDFGTDGCGLAFAYNNNIYIYDKWRGGNRKRKNKTKTQILLRDNNEIVCFGDNAKMMYCNTDDITSKSWKFFERFKMALYDKNIKKLNIIDSNDEKDVDEVEIEHELTATNGATCDSETVFVIALKHLQALAKEFLPKITKTAIADDEIQWILTVPSIWSENAKNQMKRWITVAGLVDAGIKDQCVIVYEPDCAALALKKEIERHNIPQVTSSYNLYMGGDTMPLYYIGSEASAKPMRVTVDAAEDGKENDDEHKLQTFHAGEKYILIDAGGGTVDVATHEVLDNGGVEEIIHPTGDKWGSSYIDDLFMVLLKQIFSAEWIDEYRLKSPGKYVEILEYFQTAKCTFYEDATFSTHDVQLPYEFLCFLEEKCHALHTRPEALIKQFQKPLKFYYELFEIVPVQLKHTAHTFSPPPPPPPSASAVPSTTSSSSSSQHQFKNMMDDVCRLTQVTVTSTRKNKNDEEYMEMDVRIWKCMFNAMIHRIVNHTQQLLSMERLHNKCTYLCLVGGFSASLFFQEQMRKHFGPLSSYKLQLVIPRVPMLSVVEGAAYIGLRRKRFIKARRLKFTYGIKMFFNKTTARNNGIDEDYIKHHTTKDGMVRDCFKIIARRNDRIALDEVKKTVSFKTSKVSLIPILRSQKRNPKIAEDGIEESVLKIHHNDSSKQEIITEFHFYGTLITVYSYPKNHPDDKQRIDISYGI